MSVEEGEPVISRMQFGQLAEQLREAAGLKPGEAERGLVAATEATKSFYATKLTKIESGTLAAAPDDVEAMIVLYRATADQADQLRELGTLARRRAKRGRNTGERDRQYIALESRATEIRMVYNEVPGLVQTNSYALAALSASPVIKPSDVAGTARDRAERGRSIIRPDGPAVWIALGEDALDRCSGGPSVLREQLEHLREVASMPNVSFRVILKTAGNVAALSGPFTLLETEVGKSIAYVATTLRGDYVKAEPKFFVIFDHAWSRAASEVDSLAILDARITDLATDEE